MKKAIVLFSGGLDSTTCLALAKKKGFDCYALSFQYGQKHQAELNAAKKIAALMEVKHTIIDLPTITFKGSSLTSKELAIPNYKKSKAIPSTYVPARNTIFLAFALGFAEITNAEAIFIGVSAIDYSNYPDCRPVYFNTFKNLANLATKKTVEENPIDIYTPLIHLSKAETIKLGMKLNVNYALTVSCYRARDTGAACGTCDSCALRKKGFEEAQLVDQTIYAPAS